MSIKRFLAAAVVLMLTLSILIGCAKSSPSPSPTPTQQAPKTTAPAPTTAAPKPTTAAPSPSPTKAVQMPSSLLLVGGTSDTSPNALAMKVALTAILDHYPKIAARHMLGGGGAMTLQRIVDGEAQIACMQVSEVAGAYLGWKPWDKPNPGLRAISSYTVPLNTFYWVLPNSPIKSIADFAGKRIAAGKSAESGSRIITEAATTYNGFDFKQIIAKGGLIAYTSYEDGLDQVVKGSLDTTIVAVTHPWANLISVLKQHSLRPVGYTQAEIDAINKVSPGWMSAEFPAGYYEGQVGGPINGVTIWYNLVVDKNMPDDVVYNLLSIFYEDNGRRWKAIPSWEKMDFVSDGLHQLGAPLHPGAAKYWAERGVKVGELMYEKK